MTLDAVLSQLPYEHPFLFVDGLTEINDNGANGWFRFTSDLPFYKGHFKDNPVTPGVLLIECCAQIGLVCLGIYLNRDSTTKTAIAMADAQMEFYLPVLPGEKVMVSSEKLYFRFQKLKCKVTMRNENNRIVCRGIISGMASS